MIVMRKEAGVASIHISELRRYRRGLHRGVRPKRPKALQTCEHRSSRRGRRFCRLGRTLVVYGLWSLGRYLCRFSRRCLCLWPGYIQFSSDVVSVWK